MHDQSNKERELMKSVPVFLCTGRNSGICDILFIKRQNFFVLLFAAPDFGRRRPHATCFLTKSVRILAERLQ